MIKVFNLGGLTMPRRITDSCINTGNCVPECPVDCISAGENTFVIDEDTCIDCGACEVVCPVDAIIEI